MTHVQPPAIGPASHPTSPATAAVDTGPNTTNAVHPAAVQRDFSHPTSGPTTGAAGPGAAGAGVSALAWSPCGRYVASGGHDRRVCLVEVGSGRVAARSPALGSPVTGVSFVGAAAAAVAPAGGGGDGARARALPPHVATLVACFHGGEPPCVVDVETGAATPLPGMGGAEGGEEGGGGGGSAHVALADPSRGVIFLAHARGLVAVVDASTHRVLDLARLPGSSRTLALALASGGGGADADGSPAKPGGRPRPDRLLASCHDRCLRLADLAPVAEYAAARAGTGPAALRSPDGASPGLDPAAVPVVEGVAQPRGRHGPSGSLLRPASPLLTPAAELSQAVDRTAWRGASLSEDGSFVAAATQVRRRKGGRAACTAPLPPQP